MSWLAETSHPCPYRVLRRGSVGRFFGELVAKPKVGRKMGGAVYDAERGVVIEGVLGKWGGKFGKKWQMRWVVLQNDGGNGLGAMFYFAGAQDANPRGAISLGEAAAVGLTPDNSANSKKHRRGKTPFWVSNGEREYTFGAESAEEAAAWVDAINAVLAATVGAVVDNAAVSDSDSGSDSDCDDLPRATSTLSTE